MVSRAAQLHTPRGIAVGALLGSLGAGAVLLWLNYRVLGHPRLANKVAAGGLVVYLLIITAASMLPDHLLLGIAFIALQTGLAYWAADRLQGDAVRYHLARGGRAHSLGRSAGIGLLAGLSVIAVLLILTSVLGLSAPEVTPPG
jgi:hypothetical protein